MIKKLLALLLGLLLTAPVFAQVSAAEGAAACHGQTFNPLSDPDWSNVFPITIAGIPMGPNSNPPDMFEPPVCVCPGVFGIPSYGVGITFWEPLYVSEVQKIAGCSSSLGGKMIITGYAGENSEQAFAELEKGNPHSTRMQLHWYEYPIFGILHMFEEMTCRNPDGFNLLYASEVDPTWQNDEWAGIFSPEASLFASLPAQFACMVDSVGASVGYPVDPLFWCAGTWGGVYPMAGTAAHSTSNFQVDNLILAKFLARQARIGLQFQTIGPAAECSAVINPIWLKSQFRVNQVYPIPRHGAPLMIGAPPVAQYPTMITNLPGMDDTVNVIFEGQQCCLRTY